MQFKQIWEIAGAETIAFKYSIRELDRLVKQYGGRRWMKKKGFARCSSLMTRFMKQKYTGTRRTE